MLYHLMPVPVCLLLFCQMRRCRFEMLSIALVFASVFLCYFQFYHTNWNEFTLDAEVQAGYVRHIAEHGTLPTMQENAAARHPPAYYILAAGFYRLAGADSGAAHLRMARHASMGCYLVFLFLATRLIRSFLPPPSLPYYGALCMLLFWPLGMTMGGRLTCDLLLYAGEAGCLLYLSLWGRENTAAALSAALFWAGVSVLAKNLGILMCGFSYAALAVMVWRHRRALRTIVTCRLLAATFFSLSCCASTLHHGWITHYIIVTQENQWLLLWRSLVSFNPALLLFDTSMGLSQDLFWNMLLHTLLLGNALPWKAGDVMIAYNVIWAAMLVYILRGALRFTPHAVAEKRLYWLFALFAGAMTGAALYMRVHSGNVEYSDARYEYPLVIGVSLALGQVACGYRKIGHFAYYRLGLALAFAFVPLTIGLLLFQYI